MFALEITFSDQPADIETILVRRHKALIGASENCHIEIQDMQALNYDLRLVRDLSGKFRVAPITRSNAAPMTSILEGVYERSGTFDLGKVKLNITALDSDLMLKDSEPADRAGVRVMRLANSSPSPVFPALVILGSEPFVMSFTPDAPVYVGSAKSCSLRLDAADVSPKHARIGYESGEFWIEDLGSSQGTYVNNNQISGRINVKSGTAISIGKAVTIIGITSNDQLQHAISLQPGERAGAVEERKYPVLISMSEVVRPARMVIPLDSVITIGRDPQCDMWFGAPHVSRRHCSFTLSKTGQVSVSDYSKNGTLYDGGILKKGDLVQIKDRAHAFDFGGGITLAICFNETQEKQFIEAAGNASVFVKEDKKEGSRERKMTSPKLELFTTRSGVIKQRVKHTNRFTEALYNFVIFYQSLSFRNKIALYITLGAVVVVLVVLLNLVLRLNF